MSFLNPSAFWGILFIAIPILIHLFEFRRVKKVEFSNVSFLRSVESKTSTRNRIKKLLILLIRILFIVLLVIVFAHPIRPKTNETVRRSAIYIDNSLSMKIKDEGDIELLYSSLRATTTTLSQIELGAEMQIITNDDDFTLYNGDPASHSRFDGIDFSFSKRSIPSIVNKVSEAADVFLISDFQKSSFSSFEEILVDSARNYFLLKNSTEDVSNVFVDTVFLEAPLGLPISNILKVAVKNSGNKDRKDVLIRLYKDDIQISTLSRTIFSESQEMIDFALIGKDISGSYSIRLGDSEVAFDNNYYLEIPKSSKFKVTILNETKRSRYLELAFSNKDIFELVSTPISTAGQAIEGSDLIVLNELKKIPEWLVERLSGYSGTILVAPSSIIDLDSYSKLFNVQLIVSQDTNSYTFSIKTLENPFFAGIFNKNSKQLDLPVAKSVFQLSRNSEILISLNSKVGYLTRLNHIFLLGSPINDEFTNFHKQALFLPVLYKLASFFQTPPSLAYNLDNRVLVLDKDSLIVNGKTSLIGNGSEYVPSFRFTKNQILMELPDLVDLPGTYTLMNDTDTLLKIALNSSKLESLMEVYSSEDLETLAQDYPHISYAPLNREGGIFPSSDIEVNDIPLWKYALLLALLFMISELVLLRLFR